MGKGLARRSMRKTRLRLKASPGQLLAKFATLIKLRSRVEGRTTRRILLRLLPFGPDRVGKGFARRPSEHGYSDFCEKINASLIEIRLK